MEYLVLPFFPGVRPEGEMRVSLPFFLLLILRRALFLKKKKRDNDK